MSSIIKSFTLLLFLLNVILCYSQELIPNGSFEYHENGNVTEWLQPRGGYYHFTRSNAFTGEAAVGDYYNGICLLNHSPSEFLEIWLRTTLKKDEIYTLRFYVKKGKEKSKNASLIKSIEILFSKKAYNVTDRVVIADTPQLIADVSTLDTAEGWRMYELKYTAAGGEKFLLIGKFNTSSDTVSYLKKMYNDEFYQYNKIISKLRKAELDSIKNIYKEKADNAQHSKKKKKKKTPKDYEEFKQLLMFEKKELRDIKTKYNLMLSNKRNELQKKYSYSDLLYDIRFYFDGFSLTGSSNNAILQPSYSNNNNTSSTTPPPILKKEHYTVGKTIVLKNVFFNSNKYDLLPASYTELDNLLRILDDHPGMEICINGHTDNSGDEEHNQSLSENRAKAVVDYLTGKGIDPARLCYKGFGEDFPIADNTTEQGKKLNRRVEFEIIKM